MLQCLYLQFNIEELELGMSGLQIPKHETLIMKVRAATNLPPTEKTGEYFCSRLLNIS